jgi:putative acetyltransferase
MAGTVTIRPETPLQDDVRGMVERLNATMRPLSPPEFQFQMTVEQMADDTTTCLIARNEEGDAVGMVSLKRENGYGEIKRMWTEPKVRGTGVGTQLLEAVEALALKNGIAILRLETGATPGFEAAWAVYESGGFTKSGPFGDYPNSEYNVFYEKRLSA